MTGFDPRAMAGLSPRPVPPPVSAPAAGTEEATATTPDDGGIGQAAVEAALAQLAEAERRPPDQQIAVYESVHRTLQDTLRSVES
jgi:hypothetical protein